jgi:hypothetical protein
MKQRGTGKGCYVKVTFPKEVYVDNSVTVIGEDAMLDSSGGTAPTNFKFVTGAQTDQYIIIQGCIYEGGTLTQGIHFKFGNIINPYMVKTTDPFKVQVYKTYNSGTNTLGQ